MTKRKFDIHKGEYLITFGVPKDDCRVEEQEATSRVSCIFFNFWCLSSSKCWVLQYKCSQKENIKLFLPSHSFQVSLNSTLLLLSHKSGSLKNCPSGETSFIQHQLQATLIMKSVYPKAWVCCPLALEKSRLSELIPPDLPSTVLRRGRKSNNKYIISRSSDQSFYQYYLDYWLL